MSFCRRLYQDRAYGSAEESKGGDGEEEKGGVAAAALQHVVAVAPVGAPSAAAAGLYGEWRGYS
jgi:hypothetical protein